MSDDLEQYKKNIDKFNKDSIDIIINVTNILENKDEAAAIQCLSFILAMLIANIKVNEQRIFALKNLIKNLKKLLGKK